MTVGLVKKVSGGYRIDGLYLLAGGGHRLQGSKRATLDDCRRTCSTVKRVENVVAFFAKTATARTRDHFEWGYRVKKGAVEVDVMVYDTWNPVRRQFGGHYPPPVSAWERSGWEIMSQFLRPIK